MSIGPLIPLVTTTVWSIVLMALYWPPVKWVAAGECSGAGYGLVLRDFWRRRTLVAWPPFHYILRITILAWLHFRNAWPIPTWTKIEERWAERRRSR